MVGIYSRVSSLYKTWLFACLFQARMRWRCCSVKRRRSEGKRLRVGYTLWKDVYLLVKLGTVSF